MKQNEESIFNTLLNLPLIKGASPQKLHEIAGRFRLHFLKFEPGQTIIEPGDLCDSLCFLLSGEVLLSTTDSKENFTVRQTLAAPQIITPDHLFGRSTCYPCSVRALSRISIMQISKEEYRKMLAADPVFLFNYLNLICSGSQQGIHGLMSLASGSAVERIAYWIITLTQNGSKDIQLTSAKTDLHTVMGIQASSWRAAIDRLSAAGIVKEVSPRSLTVSSRAELAALLD